METNFFLCLCFRHLCGPPQPISAKGRRSWFGRCCKYRMKSCNERGASTTGRWNKWLNKRVKCRMTVEGGLVILSHKPVQQFSTALCHF
jgi:hypothetical protein